MSDELQALEEWAGVLLDRIEPSARRTLAKTIAQQLRRSQQQRIQKQRNPDGTPYSPRKKRDLRGKKGRVKQKVGMFQRLRTATYLTARGDSNAISVGFTGRISRIARIHQYGLKDRAEHAAPDVRYDQRKILGFSNEDVALVRAILLDRLTT